MTLVVSRFDENGRLFTVTDSKFSYDNEYKFNTPYKASIILNKNLILTPRINIAYAGIGRDATILLNKFYQQYKHAQIDVSYEEVLSMAKYIHDSENHRTDFIIGFIDEKDNQRLTKISDGIVHENQKVAWIGDNEAFSMYQDAFHSKDEKAGDLTTKMFEAMNDVIYCTDIDSVGGYPILSGVSTTKILDTKTNEQRDFQFFQYLGGSA